MDTKPKISDLFNLTEQIDELTAEVYGICDFGGIAENPKKRHKLFCYLLGNDTYYTPGFEPQELENEIVRDLGDKRWNEIHSLSIRIQKLITSIVLPTYTTTSYWSPIDERRHTVIHKPIKLNEDKKRTLAYAYAFFALTFSGLQKGLYSVIQFISEKSSYKRGPRVCFANNLPEDSANDWWHIPESRQEPLMQETGIAEAIDKFVLKNGTRTESELQYALNRVLINTSEQPWVDLDSFAEEYVNSFSHKYAELNPASKELVHSTQKHMNQLFGDKLTAHQALFMLVTHLIYREACPTDYIYTFPVRVATTCCIITVGISNEVLNATQELTLSRIANSLFIHPLLLDYKAQEASARERYHAGAVHRIRGPLFGLQTFLRDLTNACNEADSELGLKVNKILSKSLRKRFERSLSQIEASAQSLSAFIGSTKPSEFEVVAFLKNLIQSQSKLHPQVKISIRSSIRAAYAWGWQSELEFIVHEIVYNSVRILKWVGCPNPKLSIRLMLLKNYPSEIEDYLKKSNHSLQLPAIKMEFSDNGPGVHKTIKERIFESGFKGRDSGSTGKGLYLVRYFVVQRLRGIVFENGISRRGAEFVMCLPITTSKL